MINTFLKAKHWQLFILTFGIPIIFHFILMGSMMSSFSNEDAVSPSIMFNYLKFMPIIIILFMIVFFGWFWSVGVGLNKKIPIQLRLNVSLFKILLIILAVYTVFFATYISSMMTNMMISMDGEQNMSAFRIIVPLHFLSMFCILYCLYFVAKTIKTAELQQEVTFGEFVGEFFLIWFYPIGIWILQPKINQLAEEE